MLTKVFQRYTLADVLLGSNTIQNKAEELYIKIHKNMFSTAGVYGSEAFLLPYSNYCLFLHN